MWGSGGIAPCILHLGTRWRRVGRFTMGSEVYSLCLYLPHLRKFYPGKETYRIGGWVGPQKENRPGGKAKAHCPCRDQTRVVQSVTQSRDLGLDSTGSGQTSGELWWRLYWSFGLHKGHGIFWRSELLVVFQVGLCCVKLFPLYRSLYNLWN
jgi:hypothetical protein